jgi:hypothetical protein
VLSRGGEYCQLIPGLIKLRSDHSNAFSTFYFSDVSRQLLLPLPRPKVTQFVSTGIVRRFYTVSSRTALFPGM